MEAAFARSYGNETSGGGSTRVSSSLGHLDVGRSETYRRTWLAPELRPPTPATNALAAAYDRAAVSRWESAWDEFVDVATRAPVTSADLEWLLVRASAASSLTYRAAESLARILGTIGERDDALRSFTALALMRLFQHPAPGARIAVLEAMAEINLPLAQHVARSIGEGEPRPLREVADAVQKMSA